MLNHILKRLLLSVITILIILAVSYLLLRLAPGDPTRSSFLGENAETNSGLNAEKGISNKNRSIEEALHLDKPIYLGFLYWLESSFLYGDFGRSISVDKGKEVFTVIFDRIPVTLTLNLWAILITYAIAIPIGVFSAVTKRKKSDKLITFFLFFLYSLPVFWVTLLLQAFLCKGGLFPIFPLKGIFVNISDGMSTWSIVGNLAMHYVLPVICLSYAGFAGLSRYCKESMSDVINRDYIRTARAKGLSENQVIYKHALKNAMITLITLFAELIPGLIAGSIIVEYIFNIPGIGELSMLALSSRDIPVLMGLFMINSILTLLGILIADILYTLADPRINFNARIA
ncbi:MAG TPA: diguanylate cyclase [Lentisphaeria bacterium]|nr:MAG: hypothetical protein A2X47_05520 [Lentisphaerae bacterium GWF2_38_69]HBM17596.1 diguanylate cyclase [Lentisphaeria bacterium]